jgi:energy-coupling factor transport system substrate-specific component
MQEKAKGLRAKDLIRISIFTVLYFVAVSLCSMLLMAVPYVSLFVTCVTSLVTGVIFLHLVYKVGKFGTVAIMSSLIGIIMCLGGHFWPCLIFGPVFGVLADFICARGSHRKFGFNVAGYVVFTLGMTLNGYAPSLFFVEAFRSSRQEMGMSSEMIEQLITFMHGPALAASFVGAAICAVAGGFIGKALLKKHFEKAGVIWE